MVSITQPQVHVWTRDEYHRMADLGFFEGRRVELVERLSYLLARD